MPGIRFSLARRGPDVAAIPAARYTNMLYTIAVILLILWALGLVSGYTIGAFIHVLLVVALVLILVGFIGGRRVA
jgi:hypothetical protein